MNFFDKYPLETGIFIVILCKIVILVNLISTTKADDKRSKFVSFKEFLKNYIFLIIMMCYGFYLIFKSL